MDNDNNTIALISADDLSSVTAQVSLSPHATISPDPTQVHNYEGEGVKFTVTAHDGQTKARLYGQQADSAEDQVRLALGQREGDLEEHLARQAGHRQCQRHELLAGRLGQPPDPFDGRRQAPLQPCDGRLPRQARHEGRCGQRRHDVGRRRQHSLRHDGRPGSHLPHLHGRLGRCHADGAALPTRTPRAPRWASTSPFRAT